MVGVIPDLIRNLWGLSVSFRTKCVIPSQVCHSGLDPESLGNFVVIEVLNQVQDDKYFWDNPIILILHIFGWLLLSDCVRRSIIFCLQKDHKDLL